MRIYIAVVQYPLAPLDDTQVVAFTDRAEAEKWVESVITNPDYRNGYSEGEMNWGIYEDEVTA